jgi:hypothetical protein
VDVTLTKLEKALSTGLFAIPIFLPFHPCFPRYSPALRHFRISNSLLLPQFWNFLLPSFYTPWAPELTFAIHPNDENLVTTHPPPEKKFVSDRKPKGKEEMNVEAYR